MAQSFFTLNQTLSIEGAIEGAERETSGEIRVHIENHLPKGTDVLDRAAQVFAQLDLHHTKLRNGVLFYLALESHQFAVLGDAGINGCTGPDFWNKVKEIVQADFRNGRFTEGLVAGITLAGSQLKEHFPYGIDDKNELPNTVSFG